MPDQDPKPTEIPEPKGATPEVTELTKKIQTLESKLEEVTTESIERRKENKSLRSMFDGLRGVFGIEGDPAAVEGKVKEAVASKDAAIKSLLLETAVERKALELGVKPERLAKIARLIDTSDVEIDLDKRALKNPDALGAKLTALKTEIPELFGVTPAADPKPPAASQDPGSPPPTGAGSVLDQWNAAKQTGNRSELAKLWLNHGPEIAKSLPKLR
jgi:hypothetical protein